MKAAEVLAGCDLDVYNLHLHRTDSEQFSHLSQSRTDFQFQKAQGNSFIPVQHRAASPDKSLLSFIP